MRAALIVSVTLMMVLGASARRTPTAVRRALEELGQCDKVDDIVCRGIPTRLVNYGGMAVAPLMKRFKRLPPAAQILGVVALQQIQHPRSARALIQLAAHSNFMVRSIALNALGERHGAAVERALIDALGAKNPTLRVAAAEALGKSARQRSHGRVVPALIRAAKDSASDVRAAALDSLSRLRDDAAGPVFVAALLDRDRRVRRNALFGLRMARLRSATPDIIELLRGDDPDLAREAGTTLERINGRAFGADYELWKSWWDTQNE